MSDLERGEREFTAQMGAAGADQMAMLRRRSPELYETVVAGLFGGPLARPELSRADRELATVAVLAALGGVENQLGPHVAAALRHGVAPTELRALCEHVLVYAGAPRALNAMAVVDDVLTRAGVPHPARRRRVALTDHETTVYEQGDTGPPVVLLHALGLDGRMWEAVMPALSAGRRVVAYDLRRHGSAGGAAPFPLAAAAEDLVALLDALELERAHVVGLSYGGGIAQTAAVAHPGRFLSLSLLATTDFAFDAFESRARSAETEGMEAQVAPSLTRWFTPAALAANPAGVRYAREQVRRGDPASWAASWRAFAGLDVEGRLAAFPAPVLVLAGGADASTTPEIMRAIAGRIPGATYEEMDGVPHMQTLERPDAVAAALDRFLPR